MNTCPNCGKVTGLHSSILQGCMCQYSMQAPAQRTWVGLTDDEMYEAVRPLCKADSVARSLFDISKDEYRAIEAKLKEKNG